MGTPESLALVVLISGKGTNLQAIIDACASGMINAEIKAVISNRPEADGLQRATQAGIATEVIDHRLFDTRADFDRALCQRIDHYQPGLVVLAGFMRILTAEFVNHYLGRLVNIHPSLLPNFQGLNTHQRALESGNAQHGASVHFVTPELDGGPVIARAVIDIRATDTPATLAARVLEEEHLLYPQVIGWYASGRIALKNNRAYLDGRAVPQLEKNTNA